MGSDGSRMTALTSTADAQSLAPPQHIYIHVPFCVDRCTYCAFVTVTEDPSLHDAYVDALLAEWRRSPQPSEIATVYLGGGTPGQLAPAHLGRILDELRASSSVPDAAEITLEVNPANVDAEALHAWSALGINRLSIGVQTFDSAVLSSFGRHHDRSSAEQALHLCSLHWEGSWSADLLVGWAGQSERDVSRDTSTLIDCGAPHVSVYGLTLEPRTPLLKQHQNGLNVSLSRDQLDTLDPVWATRLRAAGYERYEVSNFAKPGFRSQHNEAYWRGASHLGLGPGASSSWGPWRWSNERSLSRWIERCRDGRSIRQRCERLDDDARLLELLAVGLRTSDGIPWTRLRRRFGDAIVPRLRDRLTPLGADGHLCCADDGLRIPAEHQVKVDHIVSLITHALHGATPGSP